MSDQIRLEQDDVTVEEITEECGECTGSLPGAGHYVVIDLRSAGMMQRLGPYCDTCAEKIAARIRAGLPEARHE